jgi:Ca2+-transporting ATPase
VCDLLETDADLGLERTEAERRLLELGPNSLPVKPPASWLTVLLRQFGDRMVLILLGASIVSLLNWALEGAHGVPADFVVIAAIVLMNAVLGCSQQINAERTVEQLTRLVSTDCTVIRSGTPLNVDRAKLVLGDVLLLRTGERVPADVRLLASERLRVDESLLTGESVPCQKQVDPLAPDAPVAERTDMAFAGTHVADGEGRGVVVATGSNTQLGDIATALSSTSSAVTPLQRRLDTLGRQIGWAVLGISVAIAALLLGLESRHDLGTVTRVLMFSVALAVAAIPEGLPAVLTVSFALAARHLARMRAVVRRMAAVETLGSVTTILTDKTGTLTQNQMTVCALFYDHKVVSADDRASVGDASRLLLLAGVLANTADLVGDNAVGDPLDVSLLRLAEHGSLDWRASRAGSPRLSLAPFSAERARVSALHRHADQLWLFTKGSLDAVARCSCQYMIGGSAQPLDETALQELRDREAEFAAQGWRTIALAARLVDEAGAAESLEHDLVILGLAAMHDPLRPEAAPAVARCRRAGIRVVMLTGDHPGTALAVGQAAGLTDDHGVLYGPSLEGLSAAALARELDSANIVARVSPQLKLRVVETLVDRGDIVAMTGDGVNDALALKKAHVGVAMGSGSAVAIEASQVVLLDDNFATLVAAVMGGRGAYASIQRFVAFLFAGNCGVVLAMFVGTLLAHVFGMVTNDGLLTPLTAGQILWMNLVTDGAPAVAFSLGRPREEVLDAPPRPPAEPILTPSLWCYVLFVGVCVAGLFMMVLDATCPGGLTTLASFGQATPELARTAAFYTIVTTRILNAFNFHPLTRHNPYLPAACLLSWALTCRLLCVPALRALFGLAVLSPALVAVLTAWSALILPAGALYRRFQQRSIMP